LHQGRGHESDHVQQALTGYQPESALSD
jgi:hypothetical protein